MCVGHHLAVVTLCTLRFSMEKEMLVPLLTAITIALALVLYLRAVASHCMSVNSVNSLSNANFSFQFIANYVWYGIENLAGDLLLGLSLSNYQFSQHCSGQVGRIKVRMY